MSNSLAMAGIFYVMTILFVGGPYPNKGISDPIYSLFAMEVVKERERGTTNGIMHAFVEFPMGIGAGLAGPLMAMGDWQTAYVIGGGVLATAFVMYYLYFARIDSRPEPVLQPARAH
jgi:predicted MFS family arabinose efflux permease